MKKALLEYILKETPALAFDNPFGPERSTHMAAILTKLGEAPEGGAQIKHTSAPFRKLFPWLKLVEKALLKKAGTSLLPDHWHEYTSSFSFFMLYHEVADDLDTLVNTKKEDNRFNRKLYHRIQEGIAARRRLIETTSDRIWNRPDHLFACFYQLRRAFFYIRNEIVGESLPIRNLRKQVWESVFTRDMMSYQRWMYYTVGRFPTLVLGPSGSGKEIVARAIGLSRFLPYCLKTSNFEANPRESFYPVNLSALSETLVESELFGHRKGAFTGAVSDRAGLFATAGEYGSVFLDEIGEVSESIQVKLLRLLQSGEFQAIGCNQSDHYTGKIIAATHKDLNTEMQAGRFREDFYYRLCGDQVHTVALSDILHDRPEELTVSIHYICGKLFGTEGAQNLSVEVLKALERNVPASYTWPGNFRELEQAVRNIIVRGAYHPIAPKTKVGIEHIYQNTTVPLAKWNQLYARNALKNAGNYRKAAKMLDVDQRTLKKWAIGTTPES